MLTFRTSPCRPKSSRISASVDEKGRFPTYKVFISGILSESEVLFSDYNILLKKHFFKPKKQKKAKKARRTDGLSARFRDQIATSFPAAAER
jgi:hypothetical protein